MESGCACRNEKSEGTSRAAHVGFHFCEAIPNENVGLPSIYLTKAKFPVAAQYAFGGFFVHVRLGMYQTFRRRTQKTTIAPNPNRTIEPGSGTAADTAAVGVGSVPTNAVEVPPTLPKS